MSSILKLLEKARNAPNNLRFDELCKLAEAYGFRKRRQTGSHVVYKHDLIGNISGAMLPLQPTGDGKAKPYQVRQLLGTIERFGLEPK